MEDLKLNGRNMERLRGKAVVHVTTVDGIERNLVPHYNKTLCATIPIWMTLLESFTMKSVLNCGTFEAGHSIIKDHFSYRQSKPIRTLL